MNGTCVISYSWISSVPFIKVHHTVKEPSVFRLHKIIRKFNQGKILSEFLNSIIRFLCVCVYFSATLHRHKNKKTLKKPNMTNKQGGTSLILFHFLTRYFSLHEQIFVHFILDKRSCHKKISKTLPFSRNRIYQ